ncbi:putative tetratricopeptide-like helical domain superfamily [Helianthus annuus]|uniref:Pentatricopeptide repeat-containing protein n=1 Tax=Helianthus annuus TaxID=4232 RepID=A0A251U6G6_HELAN|nr:putative tetratricopeptide-like helical domain superfamily [Helianthus annuus]
MLEGISYFAKLCRNNMAYDSYTLAIALKRVLTRVCYVRVKKFAPKPKRKVFIRLRLLLILLQPCTTRQNMRCTLKKSKRKTWTTIITSYIPIGQDHKVVKAFLRMKELEVIPIPNEYTLAAVISGCANTAQIDLGQQFHGLILERIYTLVDVCNM